MSEDFILPKDWPTEWSGSTVIDSGSSGKFICTILTDASPHTGHSENFKAVLAHIKPMTRFILIFLLCCTATLHAKDYALIKQLPHQLSEAQKQGHKGWDSGNTGTMREAMYHYNDTLVAMMKDVVKTYYPKGFLPADQIDGYLKALYTVHRFKQNAGNPTGEFQGTITYLDVPAAVAEDLENTIADMVQAIVADDPAFDYKQWKKSWEQALKQ